MFINCETLFISCLEDCHDDPGSSPIFYFQLLLIWHKTSLSRALISRLIEEEEMKEIPLCKKMNPYSIKDSNTMKYCTHSTCATYIHFHLIHLPKFPPQKTARSECNLNHVPLMCYHRHYLLNPVYLCWMRMCTLIV